MKYSVGACNCLVNLLSDLIYIEFVEENSNK